MDAPQSHMSFYHQPPGPDFTFRVPFPIQIAPPAPGRPPRVNNFTVARDNQIVYLKPLSGTDEAAVPIQGFGDSAKDNEVVMENKRVGAGLKISNDHPLSRELLWSIRTVLAVEPYIAINVLPGNEFTWTDTIDYYTMTGPR
jgi:hypothetical protein